MTESEGVQLRINVATAAMNRLRGELSADGYRRLAEAIRGQKRNVKLVPLPSMAPKAAGPATLLERLRQIVSLPAVYAQGMTPYSSLYTVTSADEDGFVYATGTTNAQSGCNCHSVNTYTTLILPGGRMAGDTVFGPGEVAQATVSMQLLPSDSSGFMQANTSHVNYTQFVNNEQTSHSNLLQKTAPIIGVSV